MFFSLTESFTKRLGAVTCTKSQLISKYFFCFFLNSSKKLWRLVLEDTKDQFEIIWSLEDQMNLTFVKYWIRKTVRNYIFRLHLFSNLLLQTPFDIIMHKLSDSAPGLSKLRPIGANLKSPEINSVQFCNKYCLWCNYTWLVTGPFNLPPDFWKSRSSLWEQIY